MRFKGEEREARVEMPDDGAPKGPPIAGAGGGPSMFKVLGPTKIAIVATLAILVGALGALVPQYIF